MNNTNDGRYTWSTILVFLEEFWVGSCLKLRFCRCVCDCDAGLLFRDYDDEACEGMKLSLL